MKNFLTYIFVIAVFTLNSTELFAIKATPEPVQITQPNGTKLTIRLHGDEFHSYKTTLDGYLITENEKGILTYAVKDTQGKFKSSEIKVRDINKRTAAEKKFIKTQPANINFQALNLSSRAAKIASTNTSTKLNNDYPLIGSPKSLVILVNFTDKNFVTAAPQTAFTNLLNKTGYNTNGGTGSASDYFKDASNGSFVPLFDVVGPYTLPLTMSSYGGNDTDGNDKNPRQMVIDACTKANDAGVDFAQYDTDNDGYVDNIFVYYAGYNEAEGGVANTVWPHRWSLATNATKFDGKAVFDYACTSELRGNSGTNMCGIGTFCHEFGHVLGLPDYYATNGEKHQTISYWNIMDAGAYLNLGRTPPTYSAYDRFFLKWLVPTELKTPQNVTLSALNTSNKAYLVTQNGNHNMNGSSPSPAEFFTLENRQNTGWDTYLPGHGLLVTKIYYNSTTWYNNTPNNNANSMGVDIIEADGIASDNNLNGDPFPGTSTITSFYPTLRSSVNINKPLTFIKETSGVVSFRFMGGGLVPTVNYNANISLFSTAQSVPSDPKIIKIWGSHLKDSIKINFAQKLHFEIKLSSENDSKWRKRIAIAPVDSTIDTAYIQLRYNPTVPSYVDTHSDNIQITSSDAESISILISGKSTRPVYVAPPIATEAADVTYKSFIANWEKVMDNDKYASGYYLTTYSVSDGETIINEGFRKGITAPSDWTISASTNTITSYSGDSVPSIEFDAAGDYIQTSEYPVAATELSFFIRAKNANPGTIVVEGWNGSNWTTIETVNLVLSLNTIKSYSLNENAGFIKFRIKQNSGTSVVCIDDVKIKIPKFIDYIVDNKWTTATSDTLKNLVSLRDYYFKVKASDKTLYPNKSLKYENITAFSNIIYVKTSEDTSEETLRYMLQTDGSVKVILTTIADDLNIFNVIGQKIQTISPNDNIIHITNLPHGHIYILQTGNRRAKIIL